MIKLKRPDKPSELSDNEVRLKNEYLTSCENIKCGRRKKVKAVWNEKYIKKPLSEMTNQKCAYCETPSSHLEIEHFYCRSIYPEEVVTWSNLLLACHSCNKRKRTIDCRKEPIIDPSQNDPKEHLIFRNLMLMYRDYNDILGRNTVELFQFEERTELLKIYLKIQNDLNYQITQYRKDVEMISDGVCIDQMALAGKVEALLRMAHCEHAHSAVYATLILEHPSYKDLRERLIEKGVFTKTEMDILEKDARVNALI